ncbi:MAG: hypothetical protein SPK75_05630, partial [Victivallales bacterium]|nr:hypothetical protein [Victivallales bacterium]
QIRIVANHYIDSTTERLLESDKIPMMVNSQFRQIEAVESVFHEKIIGSGEVYTKKYDFLRLFKKDARDVSKWF